MSDADLAKFKLELLEFIRDVASADPFGEVRSVRYKALNQRYYHKAKSLGLALGDILDSMPELVKHFDLTTSARVYARKEDLAGFNLMRRAMALGDKLLAEKYGKYYKYIEVTHDPKEFAAMADWLSCMEGLVDPSPEGAEKWLEEWRAGQ